MNIINALKTAAAVSAACLLLTGCGGYHAGTVKGTSYRNADAGFRIETPDAFSVAAETDFTAWDVYREAVRQASERDALEGFRCEFAAKASECEMLVCSEPNTHADAETAFLARICNHLRDEENGVEMRMLENAVYGKTEFVTALLFAHAHGIKGHETEGRDITQTYIGVAPAEDSFVYLIMRLSGSDESIAQKQMLLDSIQKN